MSYRQAACLPFFRLDGRGWSEEEKRAAPPALAHSSSPIRRFKAAAAAAAMKSRQRRLRACTRGCVRDVHQLPPFPLPLYGLRGGVTHHPINSEGERWQPTQPPPPTKPVHRSYQEKTDPT